MSEEVKQELKKIQLPKKELKKESQKKQDDICSLIKTVKPNIRESSVLAYCNSIKKLTKELGDELNINIFKEKSSEDVLKVIEEKEKTLTSKKNKITAALIAYQILIKQNPEDKDLKLKKLDLNQNLVIKNDKYFNKQKEQKKTPTQEKNWLTLEQVKKVQSDLLVDAKLYNRKKDGENYLDLMQKYYILSLFLEYTFRNEFSDIKVLTTKEYKREENKKLQNYLVKDRKNYTFYINRFKTSDTIGPQIYKVEKPVKMMINKWLKISPNPKYLFINLKKKEPLGSNGMTKTFLSMFKRYYKDKNVSTSLLRHIVISDKLKDEPTLLEKEEEKKKEEAKVAKEFHHSKEMNELYRKI